MVCTLIWGQDQVNALLTISLQNIISLQDLRGEIAPQESDSDITSPGQNLANVSHYLKKLLVRNIQFSACVCVCAPEHTCMCIAVCNI